MLRRLLSGAGLALGLFHVWLFARQASAGTLTPETAAKWAAAAALVAALGALYRQGVPLLRGRKAVAIWVLAALLHAPAIGERLDALETPAIPEAAITLSQLVAAAAPLAGLLLLLWIARASSRIPALRYVAAAGVAPSAAIGRRTTLAFCPRPPPRSA